MGGDLGFFSSRDEGTDLTWLRVCAVDGVVAPSLLTVTMLNSICVAAPVADCLVDVPMSRVHVED